MGPGISYRDWVSKSEESTDVTLTTTATELLPINNLTNTRPKSIGRFATTTVALFQVVEFTLEMAYNAGAGNPWDGQPGMSVGCVSLINHNFPLDREIGRASCRERVYAPV